MVLFPEFDPEPFLFVFEFNTLGVTGIVNKLVFEFWPFLPPDFGVKVLTPELLELWNGLFGMHWASSAALALPPFDFPPVGTVGGHTCTSDAAAMVFAAAPGEADSAEALVVVNPPKTSIEKTTKTLNRACNLVKLFICKPPKIPLPVIYKSYLQYRIMHRKHDNEMTLKKLFHLGFMY